MSSADGKVVTVSDEEFAEAMADGGIGFCRSCGCEAAGVEPDAERYTCHYCKKAEIYGAEQLLIMGALRVVTERRGKGPTDGA